MQKKMTQSDMENGEQHWMTTKKTAKHYEKAGDLANSLISKCNTPKLQQKMRNNALKCYKLVERLETDKEAKSDIYNKIAEIYKKDKKYNIVSEYYTKAANFTKNNEYDKASKCYIEASNHIIGDQNKKTKYIKDKNTVILKKLAKTVSVSKKESERKQTKRSRSNSVLVAQSNKRKQINRRNSTYSGIG
ncbi:MAG: hypothetical protein HRU35_06895 [Rickettsiaceae bacterium]|nr:hypothetical protein [Rickettsiaceae bacterium]